ncbi:MAG: COX15/CtaA family protein [Microbacteriaceae bacterium]
MKGADASTNGSTTLVKSFSARLISRLPSDVDKRVRVIAWVSLAGQVALIATGGAVRLTASGLGCPEWPLCTEDSLVNTPEMGIHGFIEFANRLLTFVLAAIAIVAFASVYRFRAHRRDLFWITLLQGLSIPFQAVLGGITVLTGLNPYVVGAHFGVSIVLVSLTTMFIWRVYFGPRGEMHIGPAWYRWSAWLTAVAVSVTVIAGILTTGSGPHAGDNSNPLAPAPRTGFDPEFMQHVHSWPAYVTLGLTLLLIAGALALSLPREWVFMLLAIEIVQTLVGLLQARLGLPELLVGIHMVLAGLLVAAMTTVLLALRQRTTDVQAN